jgi:excisionase family DNA binding protein
MRISTQSEVGISVTAAARLAGCSPDTVLRWIEEGAIEAWRSSPRGWWKIESRSLGRYLQRMRGGISLNERGNRAIENAANTARNSRRVA